MAQYTVNTDGLRSGATELRAVQRELGAVSSSLARLHISSMLRISAATALRSRISDCQLAALNQSLNLGKLAGGLEAIAGLYDRTETDLSEPGTMAEAAADGIGGTIHHIWEEIDNVVIHNWFRLWPFLTVLTSGSVLGNFFSDDSSGSGRTHGGAGRGRGGGGGGGHGFGNSDVISEDSVVNGRVSGSGEFLGVPCSGEVGYGLLGYEVDRIGEAVWELDEGEFGARVGRELELYGARGTVEGNYGILGGEAEGSVGNVAVSGSMGVTLYEDGQLSPYIGVELEAEANVAEGEAEIYLGSENNNVHVQGEGTLLGAEASAGVGIGQITYEDPECGETVTSYGVRAEVAAEAYLAEGTVSGGFTIWGIEIDAGVTGKAGGAGVSAGGTVTSDGISGNIGAGLGLGAGVEISIDWSDFDPPSFDDIDWWWE